MVRRILCRFPAKEHLLAALVEPLLADVEGLLDPRRGCRVDASRCAVVRGRSRRRPGRPRALDREQVEAARRMHAAGDQSVDAAGAGNETL